VLGGVEPARRERRLDNSLLSAPATMMAQQTTEPAHWSTKWTRLSARKPPESFGVVACADARMLPAACCAFALGPSKSDSGQGEAVSFWQ